MNIIFLGMPMSGKTTIGRMVAEKLKFQFYDTDELMDHEKNLSIGKIIENYGEKYFRDQEKKLIEDYLHIDSHVISTGGGAVNIITKEIIKKYTHRVWLRCPIKRLIERYEPNKKNRPLLYNTTNIKEKLKTSLSARMPFYAECANIIINSDSDSPQDLADTVILNINEKN
jgi:shikimate kinase